MLYALRRFSPTAKLAAVLAAVACSLASGLALTTNAAQAAEPVPQCVTVRSSWYAVEVYNGCRYTVDIRFTGTEFCAMLTPGTHLVRVGPFWGIERCR